MSFRLSLLFLLFISKGILAQDSLLTLQEVFVSGLETKQERFKSPSALSIISKEKIEQVHIFSPAAIFNTQAGTRLEERSPGSYRINIRGSSLRSSFGVRNVKVYWNGIPLTDPSGNTYFNLLDLNTIGQIDILRGPASSLYGSGYGGVINLTPITAAKGMQLHSGVDVGSFGTFQSRVNLSLGTPKYNTFVSFNTLKADGYREHSAMNRKTLSFNHEIFLKKLSTAFFGSFSDLKYDTPGGLTIAQQNTNRRASRPAAGTVASVIDQKAGIDQQNILLGMRQTRHAIKGFSYTQSFYFSNNTLINPFITNYEERNEKSIGYRVELQKKIKNIRLWLGSEGSTQASEFDVYTNTKGLKTNLRYNDKIKTNNGFLFTQFQWNLPMGFQIEYGAAYNSIKYAADRKSALATIPSYSNPLPAISKTTHRVSLNKVFFGILNAYIRSSNGINPPTAAEKVANANNIEANMALSAELAQNNELGLKLKTERYSTELVFFKQNVQNALVRRLNTKEQEFFENIGNIAQNGIEWSNNLRLLKPSRFVPYSSFEANYTYSDFTYKNYKTPTADLSGKLLQGVPQHTMALVLNAGLGKNLGFNVDYNYQNAFPLNELNTLSSTAQNILNANVKYNIPYRKMVYSLKLGAQNILNEKYSAGYDLNAIGSRFYNPAALRNYMAGVQLSYKIK